MDLTKLILSMYSFSIGSFITSIYFGVIFAYKIDASKFIGVSIWGGLNLAIVMTNIIIRN